nr:MAG TPA: hypothetical protein [Caudoviricetes sp.]
MTLYKMVNNIEILYITILRFIIGLYKMGVYHDRI